MNLCIFPQNLLSACIRAYSRDDSGVIMQLFYCFIFADLIHCVFFI